SCSDPATANSPALATPPGTSRSNLLPASETVRTPRSAPVLRPPNRRTPPPPKSPGAGNSPAPIPAIVQTPSPIPARAPGTHQSAVSAHSPAKNTQTPAASHRETPIAHGFGIQTVRPCAPESRPSSSPLPVAKACPAKSLSSDGPVLQTQCAGSGTRRTLQNAGTSA